MTSRVEGGASYTQVFDTENRLASVTKSGQGKTTITFVYDGNGQRVKQTVKRDTTLYIGNYYEKGPDGTVTKYYYFNGQRVAERRGTTLYYLYGDHLGSTSDVADNTGAGLGEQGYYPFGSVRYISGSIPTDFGFTGQRLDASTGLMYYGARYYDAALGSFIQADTIVPEPGNPQALNRYSYVYNNPLRYTDPTGRCPVCILIPIAMKAIDYGWTAWEVFASSQTLANPEATQEEKFWANLTIALAVGFEALEPDEFLPVGLPLDDVARRAITKGAREAYEQGGEESLKRFIRENLGEHADEVLQKLGLGRTVEPQKLSHIFGQPRHGLDDLVKLFGSQENAYWGVYDEFAKVAGNYPLKQLQEEGIEVIVGGFTVTVRGTIVDGVPRIGTFFIK